MDLLKMFVVGATARGTAETVSVHRHTATSFFMRLRRLIAGKLPSYELSWDVEADESYFGGTRNEKRGREASGKMAVFSLVKRGRKVFTAIAPNARTKTLLPIIVEKVKPDNIVYTDCFKSYNALDASDFHHMQINHSEPFDD